MRLLFVAPAFSPLAARWISQLADTDWDIHIYSTSLNIHPMLAGQNITIYRPTTAHSKIPGLAASVWPFARGTSKIKRLAFRLTKTFIPGVEQNIARLIQELEPDCIHSLKTWNEGRYVLEAKKLCDNKFPCPWVHSVWGVDLHPELGIPQHVEQAREILLNCNYLLTGSILDRDLAYKLGFTGNDLGIIPSGGGWNIDQMRAMGELKESSQRKIIALKGYQTNKPGGKVLTALKALKICGDVLSNYKIVIHSAIGTHASTYLDEVQTAAKDVANHCGALIEFLPLSPPETIWRIFGKSRIALAISSADGTPNAMLEAMIMGAYPIQSDTGGLNAWIEQRVNGALVPYDDPETIAEEVRAAILDDHLVEKAAQTNLALTKARIDASIVRPRAIQIYRDVFDSRK